MNKRKLLGIAVSSILLGSFANTASSFTYDFTASTTVSSAKFAAELPSSQTILSIPSFTVKIPTPATDVSAAAPFYLIFSLKGATKFTTTPVVKCLASGVATPIDMNLQGGAGTNSIVYQLNPPAAAPNKYRLKTTGTCTMTAGVGAGGQAAQLNMTSLTSASMSAKIEYRDGLTDKNKSYAGNLVSFVNGLSPSYSASKAKVIVDVSQASLLFTTANSIGKVSTILGRYTAYLGSIGFGNPNLTTPVSASIADGSTNIGIADAVQSMQVVISGPLLGSVTTTGKIYLDSTANLTVACKASGVAASKRASGTNVSFTIEGAAKLGYLAKVGVSVCLVTNGKTSLEKGQITATLKPTPAGSYRPTVAGGNPNLVLVTKNGASRKALNLPSPENADDAYIRINNMTTGTGKVFITLYSDDGQVIGNPGVALASPLKSMEVIALSGETIAKLVNVTEWPRRAWMQIESELSDIAVQNLIRSNGTLTNMSDSVAPTK